MRIGIDANCLGDSYTGIPVYLYNIIKGISGFDRDNDYYLYTYKPLKIDILLPENFHVVYTCTKNHWIWCKVTLGLLAKKDHLDLFWEPAAIIPLVGLKNIRTLITVHDISIYLHKEWGKSTSVWNQRLFLKYSCRKADKIIAISESTKNDLIRYLHIDEKKITRIYNGFMSDSVEEIKGIRHDIPDVLNKYEVYQERYFVFVSTLEPRKNISLILQAYEKYCEDSESPWKLVMVGKRGWKTDEFDKQLRNSKVLDRIVITGYVSDRDRDALLYGAGALLYPSLYEGFGVPVLEGMMAGIPVITSAVSSLPEVGGKAALYLNDVNNFSEMAALLNKVAKMSSDERSKISEAGREQIENFSMSRFVNQSWKLLQEMVKE